MGGRGGSFCGLPLPLLVAAIIRALANYRVVHLVILFTFYLDLHSHFYSHLYKRNGMLTSGRERSQHLYILTWAPYKRNMYKRPTPYKRNTYTHPTDILPGDEQIALSYARMSVYAMRVP